MSRVDNVRRIAVLRPNAIGDFVFALPALAALRAAYPQARIVWLGRRWHREFLQGRPGPWDEAVELPAIPGVGAPPGGPHDEPAAIEAFLARLCQPGLDIALQLYGGGRHSNPFVRRLGARVSAGAHADDAEPLERSVPYRVYRNERLRLLEVVGLVGAAPVDLAPPLAVTARDEAELASHVTLSDAPLAVLQPGATDPRRCWSAERFAAVGDRLAREGAQVVINGGPDERALTAEVARRMHAPALDLQGRLPLGGLAALLARAAVVVSNDTGPLHLAQAVGAPTVGIYWVLNLLSGAPLVAGPHRELFSSRTHCPRCGAENVWDDCGHRLSFVDDVTVEAVLDAALAQLHAAPQARAVPVA